MDSASKSRINKYDRVMSRVYNQSRTSLKSSSFVTRHDIPSSVRVGAKPVVSNVSSSRVMNELPTFLNDYVPDPGREKLKRTYVVKPRKTIKSLDVVASSSRTKQREIVKKFSNIKVPESAPSVLVNNGEMWSATHLRECLSSRSHSRLKDLKDEIKAYKQTDKLMRLRSSLFKKCGVVLDDVGNVAEDKAVQAKLTEDEADDTRQTAIRFKSPYEYAAPPESTLLPEDLPDDIYGNLINERPELEHILGPSRKTKVRRPTMPYMRKTTMSVSEPSVFHQFGYPRVHSEDQGEDWSPARRTVRYSEQPGRSATNSTDSGPNSTNTPLPTRIQTHNESRRVLDILDEWGHPPWESSPVVATCYTCGWNQPPVPRNPLCHDMFESED